MKKVVRIVLALVAVMTIGMTAMAAPSISTSYEAAGPVVDAAGNAVTLTVAAPSVNIAPAAAAEILGMSSNAAVVTQDISAPAGAVFPMTITLSVPGVQANSQVGVLHWDGTKWEKLTAVAGTNSVAFVANSLSPIAVVVADGATSPKTGETGVAMAMVVAALALGTVAFVSRRKAI